jgi:hypothetical protein
VIAAIPPVVPMALKIVFLALLYFFVYRVAKSVVVSMRAQRSAQPTAEAQGVAPVAPPAPAPVRRKGKSPGSILVLNDRGKKLRTFPLEGQVQIGRADACHLKLGDTYVSQFHARIYPQDGSWFVEDLGSTNGTFLNQRKVSAPSEVRAGDRVRVGTTTLEMKG